MGKTTGISWADSTWNPWRGCSRMVDTINGVKETDPLCQFCYAARVASHPWWGAPGKPYEGLTVLQNKEPLWTGKVHIVEKHLNDPLEWRDHQRIFVGSMTDLFHEKMPFDLIDEAMYVMARANWHTYLALTKRVGRALEYMTSSPERMQLVARMKHVHWGASVGTQRHADLRMPIILKWPVEMRWLSMEPLLESVSLRKWLRHEFSANPRTGFCEDCRLPKSAPIHQPAWAIREFIGMTSSLDPDQIVAPPIHWIVVGGESGPKNKIRPTPHHYFRFLRDQAQFAGVPFFVKQLSQLDGRGFNDVAHFPEDLRIREYPAA